MTRVDELQKKYRGLPREVIIKLELHRNGIRDSEALDKVGYWARSEGVGTYQSYDRDVSLKERAQKRPGTVRPGYVKRLGSLYMKNGLGVRIERDSTSPYEIREIGEGRFALCEGDDKVEEVYFPRKPMPYDDREEPATSKGTPVSSLVSPKSPVCATIVPVRYCEYFAHGEQCKFCNYNATQEDARSIGALRPIAANLEETVEAYKILSSDVRLAEVRSSMGAFREVESETRIYFDFVEKIASGASYKPDLLIGTQPMDRKSMRRLKDAGLDCINFCVELWSADL
ncbi:MAG: hypothetical protein Q7O66_12105, partial [Dehalococcoidia bacterium]|nr:hypothetical protein [Dehalococcoidia bacterium]